MSVQAWALLTVVVGAIVGGAIRAVGWYVEKISSRQEARVKAEQEREPAMEEIAARQTQFLIENYERQLALCRAEGLAKDETISRLQRQLNRTEV